MTRPLALDLFCGCGGAAEGLIRAGYEVVGVDIDRRCGRYYPGHFICGDALAPPADLGDFDLVWSSPPCQRFSIARNMVGGGPGDHPDLIGPTRALLAGHPFTVIENVPRAPIRPDLVLYGAHFGLDRIVRQRHFELSWFALTPPPPPSDRAKWETGQAVVVTKSLGCPKWYRDVRRSLGLPSTPGVVAAREAMGITTEMPGWGVGEAIPPAYAEFIASTIR